MASTSQTCPSSPLDPLVRSSCVPRAPAVPENMSDWLRAQMTQTEDVDPLLVAFGNLDWPMGPLQGEVDCEPWEKLKEKDPSIYPSGRARPTGPGQI